MFKKEKYKKTYFVAQLLLILQVVSSAAYSAEPGNISLRPVLGFANGEESKPITDFVLTNTETNKQVGDGTSYLSAGGGLLLGLDLAYYLDNHSSLGLGYILKGNSENPGVDFLDATFSIHVWQVSYFYQRRFAGFDLVGGLGVAFHTNIEYQFEIVDDTIPGYNYTLTYEDTLAPVFSLALEKMTREGVALHLGMRMHFVNYRGKTVSIEGISNTEHLVPFDRNGNSIDFNLGATWYF